MGGVLQPPLKLVKQLKRRCLKPMETLKTKYLKLMETLKTEFPKLLKTVRFLKRLLRNLLNVLQLLRWLGLLPLWLLKLLKVLELLKLLGLLPLHLLKLLVPDGAAADDVLPGQEAAAPDCCEEVVVEAPVDGADPDVDQDPEVASCSLKEAAR